MSDHPQHARKEKAKDVDQYSKKRKGKGKEQVPPFDEHHFICYEASLAIEKGMRKALVAERGLYYQSFGLNMFAKKAWHNATMQPGNAAELIVWEFYVNALFRKHVHLVMVRGMMVSYGATIINKFFGILVVEDGYIPLFQGANRAVLNEVIQVMGIEGAEWHNIDGAALLKESMLAHNSKAIHPFIYGCMIPTGHKSEVTMDRATVNFCIHTGVLVNFGLAVHNIIVYVLKGLGTGGYVFL